MYHFKLSRVTNKGVLGTNLGKPFISVKFNGDRKVEGDAQVTMNKNSDPVHKRFPSVRETVPQLHFFPNFWNCPKGVALGSSYSGCRLI